MFSKVIEVLMMLVVKDDMLGDQPVHLYDLVSSSHLSGH